MSNATTVENLMKVSLHIETNDAPVKEGKPVSFEFIFGVGPEGITPFEKALFGKRIGETLRLDLAPAEFYSTIGHLEVPLREQTGITEPAQIQITIVDIVRAQDREVVKAMASGGSCGDCGCGCGGH